MKAGTMNRRVVLLVEGDFGLSVARDFASYALNSSIMQVATLTDKSVLYDSIAILVSSKPMPRLCAELDRIASSGKLIFLPTFLLANCLQIGPVVQSNCECCWSCFQQRLLYQSERPELYIDISRYYEDSVTAIAPCGYLRLFSRIAAARLAWVRDNLSIHSAQSEVWQMTLSTGDVQVGVPLGIHGCPRCGMKRPEQTRSTHDLVAVVSDIIGV